MVKIGNRVKETTDTTGTGTLDLNGAPTGFESFASQFMSGDTVYYIIVDDPDNPTDYEIGIGTFTAGSPNTLSRDSVEDSSNSDNKVSWTAGTKTVISSPTAAMLGGEGPLANWARKAAGVAAKTGDYTVVAGDDGGTLTGDASGNSPETLTVTLLAAATAGDGFTVDAKNIGATGTVTLDGNASETIDGATTLDLTAGQGVTLVCDGSNWITKQAARAGTILQVLQAQKTDTATTTSGSFATISGLSQAITLANSANKVLVRAVVNTGGDSAVGPFLKLTRGGTDIGVGDTAGNRVQVGTHGSESEAGWEMETSVLEWIDTPGSVGPHTYDVRWARPSGSGTMKLNASRSDTNNSGYGRGASTLTLMEIGRP